MWNKRHNEYSNEKEEHEYWFTFVKYFDYLMHRAIAITTSDDRSDSMYSCCTTRETNFLRFCLRQHSEWVGESTYVAW